MRRFALVVSLAGLILLASLPAAGDLVAQDGPPAEPVIDEDDPPIVDDSREVGGLPGTDGEEAAVRTAMVSLRKGQDEGVSDAETGRRQLTLMKAESAYRAAVSKVIFDRMVQIEPEKRDGAVAGGVFAGAQSDRILADANSGIRLWDFLQQTPNAFERWTRLGAKGLDVAVKARIEVQLRLVRIRESAAYEVLATKSPVVCISLPRGVPLPGSVLQRFNGRCTSRTIYRLAEIAERIAASFPDSYKRTKLERDADLRAGPAKEMAKIRNNLDMAEYRRLALTGLVVDPETYLPVGGMLRIRIAENAEHALVQYLDRVGRRGDYHKLWTGEPLRDFGKSLVEEIKKRSDYKILRYLETGEEPTPRQFFLIVANVIRAEQEAMDSAYRDGYLGGKWDQVDVEQLMRVGNAHGAGDDNIDDVKERLEWFIREMDAAHEALENAGKMSPQQLEWKKPRSYQLMRQMGYIETKDDDAETARYVIPETQHSFRAFAERARGGVRIPGKGMLAVVNLRNVGQAALSVIVPEMAAAKFANYGRNMFLSERAYVAAMVAGEAVAGTLLDAAMESYFNQRDARPGEEVKGVEWDRLILESAILGSALQFAGGAVDGGFTWALRSLGSEMPKSALFKAVRRHPLKARHIEAWARTALGLASETALTTFFQMYVQGNMDKDAWKTVLMNSALSRAVADGINLARNPVATWKQIKRYIPDNLRPIYEANPRIRAETLKMVNEQLAEAAKTLKVFQERAEGQEITGKRLFRELARGDLNWRDLTRVIYPAMKDRLGPAMESLRIMRKKYFDRMKRKAIKLAIRDVNRFFNLLEIKMSQETKGPAEFKAKLKKLQARREAELQLIRKMVIAPGSQDVASDIDRSSQSHWVRRHLQAIYQAEVRYTKGDGDAPTSARAFDVNEYINVLPFVTESSKYMAGMRKFTADGPGNLRHSVAMEALSLAAVMRFMDVSQRVDFLDNKRAALKARIDVGETQSVDAGRLERQIEFAMNSIANAEKRFEIERKAVADRNPGLRESEIDLIATDAIYDRKMVEISKKQFELSQIENQHSDEALKLRAEIMRDMADGLRAGIETYSSPVGIDIIVNRIQGAKNSDGSKKKVRDFLDDANFTLKGELKDYSSHDIVAMINDQLMFIAEHVHGFSSGHEGAYETGRALGKYVERAFLGMKILGLDIAEVRSRPEHDPHRRLLEVAQALAAVKDDPQALLNRLRDFSRTSPKSHESGMAEIFWLMEKVLPGMKNMTGVLAETPAIQASSAVEARALDTTYRRIRMVSLMRWRDELRLVQQTLGPDRAVKLIEAEASRTESELQWIDRKLAEMAELAEDYQFKDWKKVNRLKNAVREARIMGVNLPDPRNPLLGEIRAGKEAAEKKLEDLRRPLPFSEMVEQRLYESGAGYRRLSNRREYLRDRVQLLKDDLKKEKDDAETARKLMTHDLSGSWACEARGVPGIAAKVTVNGDYLTMELELPAPLSVTATLEAERKWGVIKGAWQVLEGAKKRAAGFADARSTEDGKEIQFLTESTSDPALMLDWSSLICRRDLSNGKPEDEGSFLAISYLPATDDSKYGPNWSINLNGGETFSQETRWRWPAVRIRQGRKIYVDSWYGNPNLKLEPGRYQAAVSVGGRTVVQPLDISEGMVAQIDIRPAAIRLIGIPDGDKLKITVRLHPAGNRLTVLAKFRADGGIGVVPGKYDLELVTQLFGSAWITGIILKPGQTLDIKTYTGTVFVKGVPTNNLAIKRVAVEGAPEGFSFGASPDGRFGPLPAGKYELTWKEGGKTQNRVITVKPGEEKHVDLR